MATTAIYNMTDTWSDGGTTYNALKMNVTNSASGASSMLVDLQVGSVTQFNVSKAGVISALGALLTSASATALAVGLNGSTNPAFTVDAATASSATGIKVKSAAAAGGVALSVTSSGTNEPLSIDSKGSGIITIAGTSTGAITTPRAFTSTSATGGIGYATGAGGAVTQGTSRTTGVTLNTICGAITLVSAAGTASWQTFTVTNSAVAATDVVRCCQKSGTDLNMIHVTNVAAGSFKISFATTGGTTTEQPVINFAIIKAVAA